MDMLFKVLKRFFVPLILMIATKGDVYAIETNDPYLGFNNDVIQDLNARLTVIEEHDKTQHHRIAEHETRDIAHQQQLEIQQKRITELETRALAHQQQLENQQLRIAELEARDLAKWKVISDLDVVLTRQQHKIEELNDSLIETNEANHNLQVALTAQNESINNREIVRSDEDNYSTITKLVRRQQPEADTVAFTAILVHSITNKGYDQNVVFDKVETNIGNAYNSHHDVFTAPVAGTYVFQVSIIAHRWCKIVVNGVNKVDVYAIGGTDHDDQGSRTLVVRLNQGDDVVGQNSHYQHGSVFGNDNLWTTFSGFLLHSNDLVNTIVG